MTIIGYRKNREKRVKTEDMYAYFGAPKKRWVVERSFSWLKRKCRRLLMRWERLPELGADIYVAGDFIRTVS